MTYDARKQLRVALTHIEHMAKMLSNSGYSFESLGEDMPAMYAALGGGLEQLSSNQKMLLTWLFKEETSAYGECHGKDLDRLVKLGLAKVQSSDVDDTMYSRVSLTQEGVKLVKEMDASDYDLDRYSAR